MTDKMQQKRLLWTMLLYMPWKGLTLWSKQPVSRNNGSVCLYKVLTDVCTILSLTEEVYEIARALIHTTRSTLASARYFTCMFELATSSTLFQVFPTTVEIKYKHYRRVWGKPICSVNLRYHCSVLQKC